MAERHLVLCGDAGLSSRDQAWQTAPKLKLCLGTERKQLKLRLHHITRKVAGNLPPEAIDLSEIAAYVYAADQAVTRGGTKEFEYGLKWRRRFRLEIPVRRPELWSRQDVCQKLASTLGFLSDDDYEFGFSPLKSRQPIDRYLFDAHGEAESGFEEVILFSGGLDSLGGAVREILQGQRKVILVSHRPVSKIYARQRELAADLTAKLADRSLRPLHVAVEVNTGKNFARAFTQRSRSFLFAALAAVVARAFGRDRIRFYENGVISLNLPIGPHVLGGRATRTTHPQVLNGFQELFSLIFGSPFTVENPFLLKTKAEILREVKAAGVAHLCARTGSCTHTMSQTTMHTHCGKCSQCIDRRLNALAANLDDQEDPPEMYASNVITDAREGEDLQLLERYYGTALEINRISSPESFLSRFGEVARVLSHLRMKSDKAAEAVFNLYRRHARDICDTMASAVRREADAVVNHDYPPTCLLSIAVGRHTSDASSHSAQEKIDPQSNGGDAGFYLNPGTFTFYCDGKPCELRNTREYWLLERLLRSPRRYLSNRLLAQEVWNDEHTQKNTIQRTFSNLRRRLKESGIERFTFDGKTNKDHYALQFS